MKASDLKAGSIVEVRINFSPEKMNQPVQVEIERTTEKYLWFKYNSYQRTYQRIGRNHFDRLIQYCEYKIISI